MEYPLRVILDGNKDFKDSSKGVKITQEGRFGKASNAYGYVVAGYGRRKYFSW